MISVLRCSRRLRRSVRTLPAVTGEAGRRVPARPKELSVSQLSGFMQKNTTTGRGANGRPQWLAENAGSVRRVVLFAQNFKSRDFLRCDAVLFGSAHDWMFSVDVTLADFDELPDMSVQDSLLLLRDFLLNIHVLPLDDDLSRSAPPPLSGDTESRRAADL